MLNDTQKELLGMIQSKLRRGDILSISLKTGYSREYVSRVLSPTVEYFNENIVGHATKLIAAREQNTKKQLEKLTA